jgi:hypothetical protein
VSPAESQTQNGRPQNVKQQAAELETSEKKYPALAAHYKKRIYWQDEMR